MPTTLQPLYGSHTAITITSLASLANNAYAGSLVVDNTSGLAGEIHVSVTIASPTSSTATTGSVTIFGYGETDGSSHYTDNVSGADATQTPTSPTNLRAIGIGNVVANSTTYRLGPFALSAAFGGTIPRKWGLVIQNTTGGTLPASGGSADYVVVQDQAV